jgi:hypothetical protein
MTMLLAVLLAAAVLPAEDPPAPGVIEESCLRQLRVVRRVYVDRLTGGETAAQMRDILIGALAASRLFVLTENQDRADAVIRGAAEDLVFTDVHTSSDGINAHANLGISRGLGGTSRSLGSRNSESTGVGVGQNDSEHSTERRHEALAAVRLVNKDGDVIWSDTEESLGAKFQGASADVANRITGKLREDFEKARKLK